METNVQYRKAKMWQIRCYPLASGCSNAFMLLMMYVSYLMVGGYGILAVLTGTILTGTRIFDGITDPIVAFICDRFNPQKGKIRTLLWAAWLLMAGSCFVLFFIGIGQGTIFFLVFYLVYIVGYTLIGVIDKVAQTILTNDPSQRPLIGKWSTIYTMLVTGLLSPVFMTIVGMNGNEYTIGALRTFCVIILIVSAVFLILSTLAIAPVDTLENVNLGTKKATEIGVKDMWKMIKENRALQMFTIAAASDKLALQTAGNTAFATLLVGVLIGKMTLSTTIQALIMPITLIGAILAARMGVRKGNKYAMVYWTRFAICASAANIVFYLVMGFTRNFSQVFSFGGAMGIIATVLFIVLMIARQIGQYGASACANAMLADVADYENYRTGVFVPGSVGACYTFVDKVVSSFATTIASLSLAAIGYVSVMPQPTDAPSTAILILVTVMTLGVPVLGWLCTLVAMKWYPLTQEKMVEIQEAIGKRKK